MLAGQKSRFSPAARGASGRDVEARVRRPRFAGARSARGAPGGAGRRRAAATTMEALMTVEPDEMLASRAPADASDPAPAVAGQAA